MIYLHILKFSPDIGYTRFQALRALLPGDELARVSAKRFIADFRRSFYAAALSRAVLGQMLGIQPSDVPISRHAQGKPYLAEGELDFSVAHSGSWVACAVARHPVGVDLECGREFELGRISWQLAASEARAAAAMGKAERDRYLLALWAAKESYIKYTGEGLASPLASISVDWGADWNNPALLLDGRPAECGLRMFNLGGMALAVCGREAVSAAICLHSVEDLLAVAETGPDRGQG
jgi:4'-phosphopantetheinyl transferase